MGSGQFYPRYRRGQILSPDAEEGRRETIVTSVLDAEPQQCARLGSTFVTLWAALTTGGFFIFGTYHWWTAALLSLVAALAVIIFWLWHGTAVIPEKDSKDVGLGLTLPLYLSGRDSVGWWAMFITMLALFTAFICLSSAIFFTGRCAMISARTKQGPGVFWPLVAAFLSARRLGIDPAERALESLRQWRSVLPRVEPDGDRQRRRAALLAGPWRTGLDPAEHVYGATVWVLVIWTAVQSSRRDHADLLRCPALCRSHDRALRLPPPLR